MRCTSFCTARRYRLKALANFYRNRSYQVKQYRNIILHVTTHKPMQDLFFFNFGSFVTWGLNKQEEQIILEQIQPFSSQAFDKTEIDRFIFRLGDETKIRSHERFNVDLITLEAHNTQIMLAISYGLAQSIRLESYEEAIQKTTKNSEKIPEELALHGKIKLSARSILKRMGEIFLERSSINLSSEYHDLPEYFWEYPSLENYYVMTEKYLDIPRRVAALNHKLDVLHEVFDMLTSQLQHRHSAMLETIIILLIAIEIVISVISIKHWV